MLGVLKVKCSQTEQVSELLQAIREQNFVHSIQIIETSSQNEQVFDWNSIVKDISASQAKPEILLAQFGKSLKFGTDKLAFYLAFARFAEINNVLSAQAELEEELRKSFGKLFKDLLDLNAKVEALRILNEIQWYKLYEHTEDVKTLKIQILVNEALTNVYSDLDLGRFITELEIIENNSENNQVYKLILYRALKQTISLKEDNELLLRLAYSIRNYSKNSNLKKEYFDELQRLLNTFHVCLRVAVNEPNGFLIRSVKYDEYLYTPLKGRKHQWSKYPAGIDESTYNPLLTWFKKTADDTAQFFVESDDNRFWIRSGFYPERFVDTSDSTYAYFSARLPKNAVKIIPSDKDNENCYIQNWVTGNYLYAGSDNEKQDETRRTIFSNGLHNSRDSSYLWNFSSFRQIN